MGTMGTAKKRGKGQTGRKRKAPAKPAGVTKNDSPKQNAFLAAIAVCPVVRRAAAAAGVSRESHYRWIADDSTYLPRFEAAKSIGAHFLEDKAHELAAKGSERMLEFLLKGAFPEKYKQRVSYDDASINTRLAAELERAFGPRENWPNLNGGPPAGIPTTEGPGS